MGKSLPLFLKFLRGKGHLALVGREAYRGGDLFPPRWASLSTFATLNSSPGKPSFVPEEVGRRFGVNCYSESDFA